MWAVGNGRGPVVLWRNCSGNLRPSLLILSVVMGYGQEMDVRRAQDAGFDADLTRPIDPETLRRLLTMLAV
jgi:CheY-like chemotaxis protein